MNFVENYFKKNNPDGKRKDSALFTVYLSGLDHDAHIKGMGIM